MAYVDRDESGDISAANSSDDIKSATSFPQPHRLNNNNNSAQNNRIFVYHQFNNNINNNNSQPKTDDKNKNLRRKKNIWDFIIDSSPSIPSLQLPLQQQQRQNQFDSAPEATIDSWTMKRYVQFSRNEEKKTPAALAAVTTNPPRNIADHKRAAVNSANTRGKSYSPNRKNGSTNNSPRLTSALSAYNLTPPKLFIIKDTPRPSSSFERNDASKFGNSSPRLENGRGIQLLTEDQQQQQTQLLTKGQQQQQRQQGEEEGGGSCNHHTVGEMIRGNLLRRVDEYDDVVVGGGGIITDTVKRSFVNNSNNGSNSGGYSHDGYNNTFKSTPKKISSSNSNNINNAGYSYDDNNKNKNNNLNNNINNLNNNNNNQSPKLHERKENHHHQKIVALSNKKKVPPPPLKPPKKIHPQQQSRGNSAANLACSPMSNMSASTSSDYYTGSENTYGPENGGDSNYFSRNDDESRKSGDFNFPRNDESRNSGNFYFVRSGDSRKNGDYNFPRNDESRKRGEYKFPRNDESRKSGDSNFLRSSDSRKSGDFNFTSSSESRNNSGDYKFQRNNAAAGSQFDSFRNKFEKAVNNSDEYSAIKTPTGREIYSVPVVNENKIFEPNPSRNRIALLKSKFLDSGGGADIFGNATTITDKRSPLVTEQKQEIYRTHKNDDSFPSDEKTPNNNATADNNNRDSSFDFFSAKTEMKSPIRPTKNYSETCGWNSATPAVAGQKPAMDSEIFKSVGSLREKFLLPTQSAEKYRHEIPVAEFNRQGSIRFHRTSEARDSFYDDGDDNYDDTKNNNNNNKINNNNNNINDNNINNIFNNNNYNIDNFPIASHQRQTEKSSRETPQTYDFVNSAPVLTDPTTTFSQLSMDLKKFDNHHRFSAMTNATNKEESTPSPKNLYGNDDSTNHKASSSLIGSGAAEDNNVFFSSQKAQSYRRSVDFGGENSVETLAFWKARRLERLLKIPVTDKPVTEKPVSEKTDSENTFADDELSKKFILTPVNSNRSAAGEEKSYLSSENKFYDPVYGERKDSKVEFAAPEEGVKKKNLGFGTKELKFDFAEGGGGGGKGKKKIRGRGKEIFSDQSSSSSVNLTDDEKMEQDSLYFVTGATTATSKSKSEIETEVETGKPGLKIASVSDWPSGDSRDSYEKAIHSVSEVENIDYGPNETFAIEPATENNPTPNLSSAKYGKKNKGKQKIASLYNNRDGPNSAEFRRGINGPTAKKFSYSFRGGGYKNDRKTPSSERGSDLSAVSSRGCSGNDGSDRLFSAAEKNNNKSSESDASYAENENQTRDAAEAEKYEIRWKNSIPSSEPVRLRRECAVDAPTTERSGKIPFFRNDRRDSAAFVLKGSTNSVTFSAKKKLSGAWANFSSNVSSRIQTLRKHSIAKFDLDESSPTAITVSGKKNKDQKLTEILLAKKNREELECRARDAAHLEWEEEKRRTLQLAKAKQRQSQSAAMKNYNMVTVETESICRRANRDNNERILGHGPYSNRDKKRFSLGSRDSSRDSGGGVGVGLDGECGYGDDGGVEGGCGVKGKTAGNGNSVIRTTTTTGKGNNGEESGVMRSNKIGGNLNKTLPVSSNSNDTPQRQQQQSVERKKIVEERLEAMKRDYQEYQEQLRMKQELDMQRAYSVRLDKGQRHQLKVKLKNIQLQQKMEKINSQKEKSMENLSQLQQSIDQKMSSAEHKILNMKREESRKAREELESRIEQSKTRQRNIEKEMQNWKNDVIKYSKMQLEQADQAAKYNLAQKRQAACSERAEKERVQRQNIKKILEEEERKSYEMEMRIADKQLKVGQLQKEKVENIQRARARANYSQIIRDEIRMHYSCADILQLNLQATTAESENRRKLFDYPTTTTAKPPSEEKVVNAPAPQ